MIFEKIPPVQTADEYLDMAFHKARVAEFPRIPDRIRQKRTQELAKPGLGNIAETIEHVWSFQGEVAGIRRG